MSTHAPGGGLISHITAVSVIIPAYNEVRSIGETLAQMTTYFERKPYRFEVIVSADGDDGTRELVNELARRDPRLKVIGEPRRCGKGYGIRQGVRLATGDVIGFVDADNKTPIQEFDQFEEFLRNGCAVVIGSRGMQQSRIERPQVWYRRVGSRVFGLVMHALVGLREIRDTQCGFKFFRRDVALDLFSRQRIDGYMFDVEILHLATRAGHRIAQVPVTWRDDGDSRLELVRGNVRNMTDLLRIRFGASRAEATPSATARARHRRDEKSGKPVESRVEDTV